MTYQNTDPDLFLLILIIVYEAIHGILEIASGILLLFSFRIVSSELAEDPQDILANWVLHHTHLTQTGSLTIGAVLVFYGLAKLVVAMCLWFKIYLVREIGLFVFGLIGIVGLYRLSFHFSWFTLLGVAMNTVTLYYFWDTLPKHLHRIKKSPESRISPDSHQS